MKLIKYYFIDKKTKRKINFQPNKPFDKTFLDNHYMVKVEEDFGEISKEEFDEIQLQAAIDRGELTSINKD